MVAENSCDDEGRIQRADSLHSINSTSSEQNTSSSVVPLPPSIEAMRWELRRTLDGLGNSMNQDTWTSVEEVNSENRGGRQAKHVVIQAVSTQFSGAEGEESSRSTETSPEPDTSTSDSSGGGVSCQPCPHQAAMCRPCPCRVPVTCTCQMHHVTHLQHMQPLVRPGSSATLPGVAVTCSENEQLQHTVSCQCTQVVPTSRPEIGPMRDVCYNTTCKKTHSRHKSGTDRRKSESEIEVRYLKTGSHEKLKMQDTSDQNTSRPETNAETRKTAENNEFYSPRTSPQPAAGVKTLCSNKPDKVDIYYFDHGNSGYYRTTVPHPARLTEHLVEMTDNYASKLWAELLGTLHVIVSFIMTFFIQLYRFIFTAFIRPLTIGVLQIFSDYSFKPLLAVIFNGLIQPVLILAYNITTSVKDLCEPCIECLGSCCTQTSHVVRAFRLVQIEHNHIYCNCKSNV